MVYKPAAQVLREAEDLKLKVQNGGDFLNDSQVWARQQRLQLLYHQVLLLDLEYALDKKVELDLWNVAFKSHISALQDLVRDKKNSRRADYQALLMWCLDAASGFYISLLHDLCDTFDIDLPFRRLGTVYGLGWNPLNDECKDGPHASSCLYICQYCMVHLGDIARYKNQRRQAVTFYRQAIMVSPGSGHPYNQLALLEANRGDKLSTVFYYILGVSVKNPFPASATNLLSTFSSLIDKESITEKVQTKLTAKEFIQTFLITHSLLHTSTDLPQASICIQSLNTTMTALVATQSFTQDELIKITAVNLYALKHVTVTNEELTEDEMTVRNYVLDLLAGSLSAFLIPVHTLKADETLLDYYALPAVKLLILWIKSDPDVLKDTVFSKRLQIWPSLCKLLNNTASFIKDFEYPQYETLPLKEDITLQAFRPLMKQFADLDFKASSVDEKIEGLIRIKRLHSFGEVLANLDVNNSKLISSHENEDVIIFEPCRIQPDPTDDLLEEIKSINIHPIATNEGSEKRTGILKPQGSLEKAREERELSGDLVILSDISSASSSSQSSSSTSKREIGKGKTAKHNIALQSIFKKMEETSKQVKFKDDSTEKHGISSIVKRSENNDIFPKVPPTLLPSFRNNNTIQQSVINSNYSKQPFMAINDKPPPASLLPYPNFNMHPTRHNYSTPNFRNDYVENPSSYLSSYARKLSEPAWYLSNKMNNPVMNFQEQNMYDSPPPPPNQQLFLQPPPPPPPNYIANNCNTSEIFPSPWIRNNFYEQTPLIDHGNLDSSGSMSMRQAMLQEAKLTPTSSSKQNLGNTSKESPSSVINSPPGYSLFNTTSWTPNLIGHFSSGNSKQLDQSNDQKQHHSFFSNQEPQSLAQLLEQQQALNK